MRAEETLTPEEFAQFQRDGYIVKRALFLTQEADAIREAFMEMAKEGPVEGLSEINPNYPPEDPLARYPRMMHPHRHTDKPVGSLAMRYMLDKRMENILEAIMHDAPIAVQSMFYFKPPGARGQDLHQDNFYLLTQPGTCYAAWVAIDDADRENGGMVVVSETGDLPIACPEASDATISFTTAHVPVPEGKSALPIDLKAGDVLFFNGSVIHGSYPNTSKDRFRRAFICHYVPAQSTEVSQWFMPAYHFNGEEAQIPAATGGGPCGVAQEIATHH